LKNAGRKVYFGRLNNNETTQIRAKPPTRTKLWRNVKIFGPKLNKEVQEILN